MKKKFNTTHPAHYLSLTPLTSIHMLMEDDMQGISKKSWAIIITDFNTPVLRQPSLDLEWSAVVSEHNPYGGEGEERKRLMPMSVAATCSRSLVSMQPYTPFFISVPSFFFFFYPFLCLGWWDFLI